MFKEIVTYKILEKDLEKRLDKIICDVTNISRGVAKEIIDEKLVLVNDNIVKASYKVKLDDIIEIKIKEDIPYEIAPVNMNLDIVYQDEYVCVVNKPQGLVVHPSVTTRENTLVHGLMHEIKDLSGINGVLRPGIVHRIDKDTSGLLMVAKNDLAHEKLVEQLVNKTVTRKYIALVYGVVEPNLGKITAPIGRDPQDRIKMGVVESGKPAVTHFQVLKRFEEFTLIECQLETGRTHQIRVHLKYIGHPLVGDPAYGPKRVIGNTGQFLHAKVLGFKHPLTDEYLEFTSELPKEFSDYLEYLSKK